MPDPESLVINDAEAVFSEAVTTFDNNFKRKLIRF